MSRLLTCSMCGHRFDPDAELLCRECPLQIGCPLFCCPACGRSDVDPKRSRLARLVAGLLPRTLSASANGHAGELQRAKWAGTLANVSPGSTTTVIGFLDGISAHHRERLQAYGLSPGRRVDVLQHSPATVIQVEHTELALEADLARLVRVSSETGSAQR